MDGEVPGAKPTILRMPPQIRGTARSIHTMGTVRARPGVLDFVIVPVGGSVVPNPPGVAIMAETFGQAWDAVNTLDISWNDGPLSGQTDASIQATARKNLVPMSVPPLGALTVEGEFTFRAAAHCPLEVDCAIADVRADRAEIWAGLRLPIVCQQSVALDLGLG
jgi:isoquinoline 1-oxidoreductase subunit beta